MTDLFRGAKIGAIVFDAFGTLVRIGEKRHPYRQLFQLARAAGCHAQPDDAARVMSMDRDLAGVADWLGLSLSPVQLATIEADLAAELKTVEAYPETAAVLSALRDSGFRLAVCSNLAAPYARAVLDCVPFGFDAYAWSFSVGAIKPQLQIYEAVCRALALPPESILMVGDTHDADCAGPRQIGMHAIHLARDGTSPEACFLRTLNALPPLLTCLPTDEHPK